MIYVHGMKQDHEELINRDLKARLTKLTTSKILNATSGKGRYSRSDKNVISLSLERARRR